MSQTWLNNARGLAKGTVLASAELANLSPAIIAHNSTTTSTVVSALEQFQECVRYLNTRRSKGAVINIKNEDDLQDVIYLMLRSWITDLVPENPIDRTASRVVIEDFVSRSLKTVIEAKFIRDKKHGRLVTKELHDDIETYRNHQYCSQLVFFIYDPSVMIPDTLALKRQIEGERIFDGRRLSVRCVIKP